MKVLIYAYHERQSAERLEKMIEANVEDSETVCVNSYSAFNEELRRPCAGFKAVVIYLKEEMEVERMSTDPQLFKDKCLILILSGDELQECSSIWRLQPTYYCYADGNHKDVVSVLQKASTKYMSYEVA